MDEKLNEHFLLRTYLKINKTRGTHKLLLKLGQKTKYELPDKKHKRKSAIEVYFILRSEVE